MLYLAWQHLWFLAGAAGCGIVIGWLTATGANRPARRGWLTLAAAVWLIALFASLIRLVNGRAAMLLETGLIYVAVYAAGCLLGGLVHKAMAVPVAALPPPEPLLALPPPATEVVEAGAEPDTPVPVASESAVVTLPEPEHAVSLPRADLPAELGPSAAPVLEPALPGERPPGLDSAREGAPDNLKRIKGIGPGNEERLRGIGIWHLDQIAAWTPGQVAWVGGYLAFPGRIEREDWVGQAKRLTGAEASDGASPIASAADRLRNALDAPRGDAPDRLTLLAGIGPGLADRLNRQGIWHFEQVAALRERELADLLARLGGDAALAAKLREDADILAHGGETAHSRAVKSGRVTPRD